MRHCAVARGKTAPLREIIIARKKLIENELAKRALDIAFKIHKKLGPGLFESVYEEIFCYELDKIGLKYRRQKPISIFYEDIDISHAFIADIILENKLIIELKSVKSLQPVHKKQLLTYLKLTNIKLGLLINFNEALLKNGIKRIVNNL